MSSKELEFTISSELDESLLDIRKSMFSKEKYKDISVKHYKKIIKRFHSLLFEDKELKELELFIGESCEIELSQDFPLKFLDKIVEYLYFREVSAINLKDLFEFLDCVRFFRLFSLEARIYEYLLERIQANDKEFCVFCVIQLFSRQILEEKHGVLEKLMRFFEKNFESFLEIFEGNLKEKFKEERIPVIFSICAETMRKLDFSNEKLVKFMVIFKDLEGFSFRNLIEKYLKLEEMDLNALETYCGFFSIKEDISSLKFRVLSANLRRSEQKIRELSEENASFRKKIKGLCQENEDLREKSHGLMRSLTTFEEKKELFEGKTKKKSEKKAEKKRILNDFFLISNPYHVPDCADLLNFTLFQHFQRNVFKICLFDSRKDNIDAFFTRLVGRRNLVFAFETADDLKFGVFFSIELPKLGAEDRFYKDSHAFIFDLKSGKTFKAEESQDKQLRTFQGYLFCVGDSKKCDGFEVKDLKTVNVGRRSEQFQGENNLFGVDKRESKRLERIGVYQVKKGEEELF